MPQVAEIQLRRNMANFIHEKISETSSILTFFFGISPARIIADLSELDSEGENLRQQECESRNQSEFSAQEAGETFHRRLLLGARMVRTSKLSRDLILFAATITAHEIAELSCSEASGRGQLQGLCEILEDDDGTGSYEDISAAIFMSDSLIERIQDSIFLEVLKRYELESIAMLFENNRPLFEIRCEVGRRLLMKDLVDVREHKETVARFREVHGLKFAQEFLRRLRHHDILPS